MNKHRLELFSDGVFAIILTLLVLDLRPPVAHGLDALREVWPALLVHTASFALVGILWSIHHGGLERVTAMTTLGLRLNLVCLFWPTLIPYGAKSAAERPLEAFGPSLMAASTGFFLLTMLVMRRILPAAPIPSPELKRRSAARLAVYLSIAAANIAAAGLAWVWPWTAYAAIAAVIVFTLLISHPSEMTKPDVPSEA